jgi:ABC-type spermidine/putrescine transport system permease subunit II
MTPPALSTVITAGSQVTPSHWSFGAIRQDRQLPKVNAVVVGVTALTVVPIIFAPRISSGQGLGGSTRL